VFLSGDHDSFNLDRASAGRLAACCHSEKPKLPLECLRSEESIQRAVLVPEQRVLSFLWARWQLCLANDRNPRQLAGRHKPIRFLLALSRKWRRGACWRGRGPPLPPSFHPHSLVSDVHSVPVGRSRFSRCCHLIIDLASIFRREEWARRLSQSPKLGGRNSGSSDSVPCDARSNPLLLGHKVASRAISQ
jgi:hypothetical protein